MATRAKLVWQPWEMQKDGTTPVLPANVAKLYGAYQAKMDDAKIERTKFENLLIEHMEKSKAIPAGQVPVFGYAFGKLAVAFAPKAGAKAATFSLKG